MITTNKDNLPKLIKAIKEANKSIDICSAWIRSETLKKAFSDDVKERIKTGQVKLRVIVRLGEEVDVAITDPGVFTLVNELGAELKYHRKLHSKMYVVDGKFAMLGSFNLTGGGFGDDQRAGSNPETGVVFNSTKEVKQVQESFNNIWELEAKPLEETLLGFVLNPSAHDKVFIVGTKPLELNRYVEIPAGVNERLLGKVALTENYGIDFYSHPSQEGEKLWEMKKAYSSNNELAGLAKAIASTQPSFDQMHIAQIDIVCRLIPNGDNIKRETNMLPPKVGAQVFDADPIILENIYNKHNFAPAALLVNRNIKAGFDPFELTTKHMAIFGSTGSGKSYFAKTLLFNHLKEWYCSKEKQGRIIILDPHGEYAQSLKGEGNDTHFKQKKTDYQIINSAKYNLTSKVVQDAEELIEACDIKPSRSEKQYLSDQLKQFLASDNKKDIDFVKLLKASNQSGETINYKKEFGHIEKSIEKSLPQYLDAFTKVAEAEVDEEIRTGKIKIEPLGADGKKKANPELKAEKEELVFAKALGFFGALNKDVKAQIKAQIIQKNFYDKVENYFEKEIKLLSDNVISAIEENIKAKKITFQKLDLVSEMNEAKIYCIDLSAVHEEDVRYELSATILKQTFNDKKEGKGMDTVFVVEEAHNFAPERKGSGNQASKILQKIAAEGRKFNIGLMIITQRPASVSKGVLNQCSTQAVFRLVNPNDIGAIKESIEGITEKELEMLPKFRQGEGIFTGVAIEESVLVKV